MPEAPSKIAKRLEALITPGYRENLLAKGLARGLIWRDGNLPTDAPNFGDDLTTNLLDHGFHVLAVALRLREAKGDQGIVRRGLYAAAEAIESAARHNDPTDAERGFHLTVAAAAFHIGGFAARAFTLFDGDLARFNLASYERALVQLMRRDLRNLRVTFTSWLADRANSDVGAIRRLRREHGFTVDSVVATALTRRFHRAIATFEAALLTGRVQYFQRAVTRLHEGEAAAAEANHVPLWWAFKLARHLFDDLWENSLRVVLPADDGPALWRTYRERFIQMLASRDLAEIDLWPSQLDAAARVVDVNDDLVVALPTSAGKTRIAELCILRTLAEKKRVIYVTPLRALSAQIEFGLARVFRPLGVSVTSVYGASGVAASDLETLQSASIVVATPEKLDFAVRQEPSIIDDVGLIVLDEGHMIGLSEREIRYEMMVQRLLRRSDAAERRLVCLSAVFSEGEAFDDFTAWLRSDADGTAVRSTWRPTRQRPGRLLWTGSTGRLEFDVEQEQPFVPKFVESMLPFGRRKNSFPQDDEEFVVAATSSFLRRGQTVLVYCPKKASVESTARAFLLAGRQGYFSAAISTKKKELLADAIRIGEEWLGKSHPAVTCLPLGIAVHHGSLPRQFLGEVENLLRQRVLPVCICSPTLAQGLDLCFSVLLFRSLYRYKMETIPAKEFANVVGRVGRAFVDLDGLYVLPIFETDRRKVRYRLRDFQRLINEAKQRQLESGVRDLVGNIVHVFQLRLGCDAQAVAEYVLNANSSWSLPPQPGDKLDGWLDVALNELDSAILGIVDVLELPTEEVADYLDKCLQSSYWQRRLQRETPALREVQEKVIRGRAQWIWNHSTAKNRRAYFASGIGYKAGSAIDDNLDDLGRFLRAAEKAIKDSDIDAAIEHTVNLAEILFSIGPFMPHNNVKEWKILLGNWLRGIALGSCTDNDGISFIQEDVVYRLVWGVEAAHLHLDHARQDDEESVGDTLALCLTYGVPNGTCALFMQAGIRSRTLATSIPSKTEKSPQTMKELRSWLTKLRKGEIEPIEWSTDADRAEWKRFLERFGHREITRFRDIEIELDVKWRKRALKPGTRVRISRIEEGDQAVVCGVSGISVAYTTIPADVRSDYFLAVVSDDQQSLRASFFGY